MTSISGNTYPVKDQIRALGGKWDADSKCWQVPDSQADAARKLVAQAPTAAPAAPGKCRKCGRACKAPYTMCWGCKCAAEGKCANCGDQLD